MKMQPHAFDQELEVLRAVRGDALERARERARITHVAARGVADALRPSPVHDRGDADGGDGKEVPRDALAEHAVTDLLADLVGLEVRELVHQLLAGIFRVFMVVCGSEDEGAESPHFVGLRGVDSHAEDVAIVQISSMWIIVRSAISPPIASAATGSATKPPTPSVDAVTAAAPVDVSPADAPLTAHWMHAMRVARSARAAALPSSAVAGFGLRRCR